MRQPRSAPLHGHGPRCMGPGIGESAAHPERACMAAELAPSAPHRFKHPDSAWRRLLSLWGGGGQSREADSAATASCYVDSGSGPHGVRPCTAPAGKGSRATGRVGSAASTFRFARHIPKMDIPKMDDTSAIAQSASLPPLPEAQPWVAAPWESWSKKDSKAKNKKESDSEEEEEEEDSEEGGRGARAKERGTPSVTWMSKGSRVPLSEVIKECNREWFEQTAEAAEQGDVAMQLLLGQMLIAGYGTPKNPHVGLKWLERAAGRDPEAQAVLDAMRTKVRNDQKQGD